MRRYVILDSSVLGLFCLSPGLRSTDGCKAWVDRLDATGDMVMMPDVTIYEVRRELIRLGAMAQLFRLEKLHLNLPPAPLTPEAWLKAAEFWAIVRKAGKPTLMPSTAMRSSREWRPQSAGRASR